eukprot:20663_1
MFCADCARVTYWMFVSRFCLISENVSSFGSNKNIGLSEFSEMTVESVPEESDPISVEVVWIETDIGSFCCLVIFDLFSSLCFCLYLLFLSFKGGGISSSVVV